jgi:repressor LexA
MRAQRDAAWALASDKRRFAVYSESFSFRSLLPMSLMHRIELEKNLTSAQRQVLQHLRAREARTAEPPTLDELCQELGLASRGSLHKHIRALVDAGFVVDLEGKQRGVRLRALDAQAAELAPDEVASPEAVQVPLLGKIAAGRPIEALAQQQRISAPVNLLGRTETFALEVKGDSMQDAGILDGDVVLIEKRSHARNGEIVVALVDRSEATLKRLEQQPGVVHLHAANKAYPSQRYAPDQVEIQGVLVGLMRRY